MDGDEYPKGWDWEWILGVLGGGLGGVDLRDGCFFWHGLGAMDSWDGRVLGRGGIFLGSGSRLDGVVLMVFLGLRDLGWM